VQRKTAIAARQEDKARTACNGLTPMPYTLRTTRKIFTRKSQIIIRKSLPAISIPGTKSLPANQYPQNHYPQITINRKLATHKSQIITRKSQSQTQNTIALTLGSMKQHRRLYFLFTFADFIFYL
jgi:hypothetical protein